MHCKSRIITGTGRVVVMSATVDADKFSLYWRCPVLYVEGRLFPVNIRLVSCYFFFIHGLYFSCVTYETGMDTQLYYV
jgi:hypothetical protein